MVAYKIQINKEKCIGCGACAALLPEIFDIEGGKAIAKKSEINDSEKEKVKDAINGCPVKAIKVAKK